MNSRKMTTFGFRKHFMIAIWKARTLAEPSRIEEVRKKIVHCRIDILGFKLDPNNYPYISVMVWDYYYPQRLRQHYLSTSQNRKSL